jgi:hypothetical protein
VRAWQAPSKTTSAHGKVHIASRLNEHRWVVDGLAMSVEPGRYELELALLIHQHGWPKAHARAETPYYAPLDGENITVGADHLLEILGPTPSGAPEVLVDSMSTLATSSNETLQAEMHPQVGAISPANRECTRRPP